MKNLFFLVFALVGVCLRGSATIRYVDLTSTNPIAPFVSWETAATTIQEAIDVAVAGDEVLVTNGIYQTGGRVWSTPLTNRVIINKSITVKSVNGPSFTTIQGKWHSTLTNGSSAIRCVEMTGRSTLSGFKVTGGATLTAGVPGAIDLDQRGGGISCSSTNAVVTNCWIINNAAYDQGGGVYRGTLQKCLIISNTSNRGGGSSHSILDNCIVRSNIAYGFQSGLGGGTFYGSAFNCTIVNNSANIDGGGTFATSATNCVVLFNTSNNADGDLPYFYSCTILVPVGFGNFYADPLFLNLANGDLWLQSNSPCINAGHNGYVTSSTDFAGNPRIMGGTVDVGAYEFQSPSSILSYVWAQQYDVPIDGTADYADEDGDGMDNFSESRAGTNPTNALSVLKMVSATNSALGLNVTWQSFNKRRYFLERATDLSDTPSFQILATNIPGATGTKTYNDTTATNAGVFFYRVGIE